MQAATIGIIKTIFLKKMMRNTFATNHKTVIKLGCICTCSNNCHYVIVCVLQTDCSYNLCSTEHMQYKSNKRWCNHNHCSNETIWSRKILLRVWQLKSCNYLKGYFNLLLRDKLLKAVKNIKMHQTAYCIEKLKIMEHTFLDSFPYYNAFCLKQTSNPKIYHIFLPSNDIIFLVGKQLNCTVAPPKFRTLHNNNTTLTQTNTTVTI